jgi:transposase
MEQFIGCDAHKKYSVFVAVNERGEAAQALRVGHDREQYRQFLQRLPVGSQIALEASGHYYWIVDEMEAAGHHPRLVHPLEAKKRMGKTGKKTDKVDANGLGILLRNGTLPEVWIPPAQLRDQWELLGLRMFLVRQRTRLKNRIQGALARYNIQIEVKDVFSVEGRRCLGKRLEELPEHTCRSVELELVTTDFLEIQIEEIEKRLAAIMQVTAEADLLKTLPYVGRILSMVMALEIGKVERFPSAAHLASYAGLVPRRRTPVARWIRRSDHPSCPNARTCCFFCSLKTLLTATEHIPLASQSTSWRRPTVGRFSGDHQWPVLGVHRGQYCSLNDSDVPGEIGTLCLSSLARA